MPTGFRISSLVPSGLTVESVRRAAETIVVTARAEARVAACPLCGASSRRVHSRYIRPALATRSNIQAGTSFLPPTRSIAR